MTEKADVLKPPSPQKKDVPDLQKPAFPQNRVIHGDDPVPGTINLVTTIPVKP